MNIDKPQAIRFRRGDRVCIKGTALRATAFQGTVYGYDNERVGVYVTLDGKTTLSYLPEELLELVPTPEPVPHPANADRSLIKLFDRVTYISVYSKKEVVMYAVNLSHFIGSDITIIRVERPEYHDVTFGVETKAETTCADCGDVPVKKKYNLCRRCRAIENVTG